MEEMKLCESDYRFMCVIWSHEPLPSRELVERCAQTLGWKKSTTYTVLKKLCDRGFARNQDAVVTSLVPRSAVQAYESKRLVDRAFAGSLPGVLVAFLGDSTLSEKEAEELKRLIDEHKEG